MKLNAFSDVIVLNGVISGNAPAFFLLSHICFSLSHAMRTKIRAA